VAEPAHAAPADPEAIRAQLGRIHASADFDVPERARKFLSYVVEETLAGRAERIKAYSIALEVFRRDPSFDPQADPVVRIEAGRVRRALERYYLTAGRADPLLITIPKGGYVPQFTANPAALEAAPPRSETPAAIAAPLTLKRRRLPLIGWIGAGLFVAILPLGWMLAIGMPGASIAPNPSAPDIPRLLVEPFEDLSASGDSAIVTRGLAHEIIGQIARFKDLVVIDGARLAEPTPEGASSTARYVLGGSVRLIDDEIRLTASLRDARDGSILWAQNFGADTRVQELLSLESEIARDVTTALAQPYGVIFQADFKQVAETPPEDWAAYTCTLAYYTYRADLNPQIHAFVRECLERTVREYPSFATAWALLSITYLDEFRFQYMLRPSESPPLDMAFDYARRAIEIDSQNARAQQAYMMALSLNREMAAALEVGAAALALNPNDVELRSEYGIRLALSGDWEEGQRHIQEALLRMLAPQGYYEGVLALCAYMLRDYPRAGAWIRRSNMTANPIFHLIAAGIYARLGDRLAASREVAWLTTNSPKLVENVREEVAVRVTRPKDQAFFLEGLVLAGLPVPGS
jgi:TolB-like protein